MSNGDESMSPAEFAKLMGAYPEPANNPLPAYGGYMDNSPANFAWVNNNDYFGAEMTHKVIHWDDVKDKEYKGYEKPSAGLFGIQSQLLDEYGDVEDDDFMFFPSEQERDAYLQKHSAEGSYQTYHTMPEGGGTGKGSDTFRFVSFLNKVPEVKNVKVDTSNGFEVITFEVIFLGADL